MFWIEVHTDTYNLRIKPVSQEDRNPDLDVELTTPLQDPAREPQVIKATIAADLLVEWVVTQLLWSTFVGHRPGVTITHPATPAAPT